VTASDVMTTNPATVGPRATVAEVWDLMRELDIRHVPVVEGSVLVGMLSDRDVASVDVARLVAAEGGDVARRQLATPVIKVMSSDIIAVEPETELSEVIGLLLEHRVGAVPVVGPGGRELVGIVSYVDILRAVQDLLSEEE
jgi:acetoin utilization protein AcuB